MDSTELAWSFMTKRTRKSFKWLLFLKTYREKREISVVLTCGKLAWVCNKYPVVEFVRTLRSLSVEHKSNLNSWIKFLFTFFWVEHSTFDFRFEMKLFAFVLTGVVNLELFFCFQVFKNCECSASNKTIQPNYKCYTNLQNDTLSVEITLRRPIHNLMVDTESIDSHSFTNLI
jgi:hypothetical protein